LYRAGHMIDRLYRMSNEGSEWARDYLVSYRDLIADRAGRLDELEKEIKGLSEQCVIYPPGEVLFEFDPKWDNKMFHALVGLLIKVDEIIVTLNSLKESEQIDNAQFKELRRRAANPIRSILDAIYKDETERSKIYKSTTRKC